jgi:hypothetical protein
MFAIIHGDTIYEARRMEYLHDDRMPFVFKNKTQVRAVLAYINQMIDIRSKYKVPKE